MAVLLAIAYLVLVIYQNILCWAAALISVLIYLVIFFDAQLYMESVLQIFYAAMAVYGWYQWTYGGDEHEGLRIATWRPRNHALVVVTVLGLSSLTGWVLSATDAAFPYLDSFTTLAAIVATYMVARKVLENWIYWFVIDALSVYLYASRDLYLTAALYVLYLVMIVIGFRRWWREWQSERSVAISTSSQLQLDEVFDRLGLESDSVRVGPLGGGLLKRSYRLSSAAGAWAARLPAESVNRFRLGIVEERNLLEALSAAGLTAPVAAAETGDVIVTRYLDKASAWSAADARDPDNIARVAARLRELHRIDHGLPGFSASLVAEDYQQLVEARHRLALEQRDWMQQFLVLAAAYDAESSATTLCHHDLVAENILDDGELWFIDFEYAVCAEPILDLAGLAGMNDFSDADQLCLLYAYYEGASPPFSMTRFAEVIRLLRLQSYFWALSSDGPKYEDEALERFVENMAAMLR